MTADAGVSDATRPGSRVVGVEVVEDRTAGAPSGEGFLRVRRLVLKNVLEDGTRSRAYACDVMSRSNVDAVAVVLYEAVPGAGGRPEVRVALRSGWRAPVLLRREKPLVQPDARPWGAILEIVAGMLEGGDAGPGGVERRAAAECAEEAGITVDPSAVEALGAESFPSPGVTDEKVHFRAVRAHLGGRGPARGDGSAMEEGGEVVVWTLQEAIAACRDGRIPDMKTEVALVRLADRLGIPRGTAPPAAPASPAKVLSEDALEAALVEHRRLGRRIVFTNGAFDLLHVGHVRMLEAAAARGDVLVAAVNDDASVRAAKGEGRPVVPAAERAEVVAALACVSHVVVFPDATVDRLLRRLRPHVHAKGRDYDDATLPEAATDADLSIRTAFVGDEKGHASRDLAAKARARGGGRDARGLDVVDDVPADRGRALVLVPRLESLRGRGFLDVDRLLALREGVEVNRHASRVVRRIEADGETLFLKVERRGKAWGKAGGAFHEFRNHLALRAAGFLAPEPWLAVEGKAADGKRVGALLTRDAGGIPLDRFLAERLPGARPSERAAWARGIGLALRALHTARFLHPDLLAYHLHVCSDGADGTPAGGARSIAFLDLARVSRAGVRVGPVSAAPGLAALALSLRGHAPARFRLAILRAYVGGRLRGARPWLRAIEKRIRRVSGRGTFRRYAQAGP